MSVAHRSSIPLPLVPVELAAALRHHCPAFAHDAPAGEEFVLCPFRERPTPLAECLECHHAGPLVTQGGATYVHCYRLEGPYAVRRPGRP